MINTKERTTQYFICFIDHESQYLNIPKHDSYQYAIEKLGRPIEY